MGHKVMGKLLTSIIVLLAVGLFVAASYSPIYRLRTIMPPQFVDAPSSWPAEKQASEAKIAKAYWDCAASQVQWRYGYGYRLPQNPPDDFSVASQNLGATSDDPATRARYWQKLQKAWYVPDNWTKSYQWDTRWSTDWVDTMKRLTHGT